MPGLAETTSGKGTTTKSSVRSYTQLAIDGMTCGNCARHITEALQSVPGVLVASVSLDSHEATVRWTPDTAPNEEAVVQAVVKEGFDARVITEHTKDAPERLTSVWTVNLVVGIPVTALLMFGEWGLHLGTTRWFQWCSFVLAAIVQVFAGA